MGYKNVCLNCKRVESLGVGQLTYRTGMCPECSSQMQFVSHKFRPPKLNDQKAWDVAESLISKGFRYQTIYDENRMPAAYPTLMRDVQAFVDKYSSDSSIKTVRRIHAIEKQIIELESREKNKARDTLIRDLKSQLQRYHQQ